MSETQPETNATSNPTKPSARGGPLVRFLARLAEFGNRLPDPLTFFVLLALVVVMASVLFEGASAEVVQRSGEVQTKTVV
ncbi:MAG: hypothetical protein AAFX99_29755, partial [Myxococcota bacterium]